jgi:hypothetical protein
MTQYLRKNSKLKEFLQLLFSNPMGFGGVAIITVFLLTIRETLVCHGGWRFSL